MARQTVGFCTLCGWLPPTPVNVSRNYHGDLLGHRGRLIPEQVLPYRQTSGRELSWWRGMEGSREATLIAPVSHQPQIDGGAGSARDTIPLVVFALDLTTSKNSCYDSRCASSFFRNQIQLPCLALQMSNANKLQMLGSPSLPRAAFGGALQSCPSRWRGPRGRRQASVVARVR